MGAEIATTIAAIATATSAAGQLYYTFTQPKVKIPTVKIPEADLRRIDAVIQANKALSDAARSTIKESITAYNEGRLSPQYQAKLDEWWKKASTALQQRLAAAGLENSTIAQTAYNELTAKYTSLQGDLLRQQLSDALSLTGLAQQEISDILSKVQTELGAQAAYAQTYGQAMPLSQLAGAERGKAFGALTESMLKLPDTLEKLDIFKKTGQPMTGTEELFASQYPLYGAPY